MNYVLKGHFPMIRDREDILSDIRKSWKLSQTYAGWEEKQRNEFLDIIPPICYYVSTSV
jgi:hypothetical protein